MKIQNEIRLITIESQIYNNNKNQTTTIKIIKQQNNNNKKKTKLKRFSTF